MSHTLLRYLSTTLLAFLVTGHSAHAIQASPPSIPGLDPKLIEEMTREATKAITKAMEEAMKNAGQQSSGEETPDADMPDWLKAEQWSSIVKGMTAGEVIQALGIPARVAHIESIESWSFGLANEKQELAATDVVGQISIENGRVADFSLDRQRLKVAQAAGSSHRLRCIHVAPRRSR